MTQDDISLFYQRVVQFCLAKYNRKPDYIRIESAGYISAVFDIGCYGSREYDYEGISLSDLNSDLDVLIQERLEKEKKLAEEQEKIRRENERRRKEQEGIKERAELKRLLSKYRKDTV
jgi:hypothetical protein